MHSNTPDIDKKTARTSKIAALGAILAFVACNGVFILIAIFAALGISLAINPHVQAAVISSFALITLAMVFFAYRKNRARGPLILCAIGAFLIIGAMYIHYDKIIESLGLMILFVAALWSWRVSS